MCEATAVIGVAQAGLGIMGAANEQRAAEEAVGARNRAKLKRAELQDQQYLTNAMLNNAVYKNDTSIADVKFDQVYQSMMDQWVETDRQLDRIFAKGNYKVEEAIRKMYENDYAGTQTGSTAARLAGKSAREAGYAKSQILHGLMMSEEDAKIKKDAYRNDAMGKQWEIYDKVRFSPIHGHAPARDFEMEAAPSRAGMYLSMAQSALGGISSIASMKAPPVENPAWVSNTNEWDSIGGYTPMKQSSAILGQSSAPINYGAQMNYQRNLNFSAPPMNWSTSPGPFTGVNQADMFRYRSPF